MIDSHNPLPFSPETLTRIVNLLIPEIPLKLILLSRSHYNSIIPSIYKNVILKASNADTFRYGIRCIQTFSTAKKEVGDAGSKRQEEGLRWNSRKCNACSFTETLVLEDETCLIVLDSILQTCLSGSDTSKKATIRDDEEGAYESQVVFPNLKKVILHKSLINLFISNPISSNFFEDRLQSLKYYIPQNIDVHVDLSFNEQEMTKTQLSSILKLIKAHLQPFSLSFKLNPQFLAIPAIFLQGIERIKSYIDLPTRPEDDAEEEEQREKLRPVLRRGITMSLRAFKFDDRNWKRVHPVRYYLRDQTLIDYMEGELAAYGDEKDRWVVVRRWEEEDDWMRSIEHVG